MRRTDFKNPGFHRLDLKSPGRWLFHASPIDAVRFGDGNVQSLAHFDSSIA